MNIIKKTIDLGNGRTVEIETGKLAKQADGSAVVKYGNTMLLATVCADKNAKEGVDFMPLTVEYRENMSSVGRIPGSFFRREAKPSDGEVLISRLIDRALRPLFPDDFHANVVVQVTLVSGDLNELPDALACLAASAALSVSDIPFNGPISEVRVARTHGKLTINPSKSDLEHSSTDIDLIVAASDSSIVMVEGEMNEVSEEEMVEAILFAHEWIRKQIVVLKELESETGNTTKRTYEHEKHDPELLKAMTEACFEKAKAVAAMGLNDKAKRLGMFDEIFDSFKAGLSDDEKKEKAFLLGLYSHKIEKDAVREVMLLQQKRLDGRRFDEVRSIWCEVGYLPGPHGSALFTRGETQSLTTVTLGTKLDAQLVDGAIYNYEKRYMLHYNFPPFSTGEARVPRGTGRREVGHGNLAQRALSKVLPADFPYTLRIVSDILESNGSSSMATVCAGTLALMDTGVKITSPVSGIAMGLVTDDSGRAVVLSDILGDEDHLGDMDFKVCGTRKGITACQMDIKIHGLSKELLQQALQQAKAGRLHILDEMAKTMAEPREDFKSHVPRVEKMIIDSEYIGAVIGLGGKIIQEIQRQTNTTITIEEKDRKGHVEIFSNNKEDLQAALRWIKGIVAVPVVGDVYDATVKSIMPYGAFVEFLPGKQGLLHISEISHSRLESMDGIFKENDTVRVKLLEVDPKTGKFKLSRKVLLEKNKEN